MSVPGSPPPELNGRPRGALSGAGEAGGEPWFPGSGLIVVTSWFLSGSWLVLRIGRGGPGRPADQGVKVTGSLAGGAPVGGTCNVFKANSITCL